MTYHEWFGTKASYLDLQPHEHDAGDISGAFSQVRVIGDIFSTNWDGAIPAGLTSADTTATTGFYIDSSAGSAEFAGNIWVQGDLSLMALGTFKSAASGRRVEITGASPGTYTGSGVFRMYSGEATEEVPGILKCDDVTYLQLMLASPIRTNDFDTNEIHNTAVVLKDFDAIGGDADQWVFSVEDVYWGQYYMWLTADLRFGFSDASEEGFDMDSYLQWVDHKNWAFYMGDDLVLDLHETYIDAAVALKIAGQAVTFGANDSGGAGYRLVRVPNTT